MKWSASRRSGAGVYIGTKTLAWQEVQFEVLIAPFASVCVLATHHVRSK